MKFEYIYLKNKIKKNLGIVFLSMLSLSFIVTVLTLSLNGNNFIKAGSEKISRSLNGNSDIVVSIGADSSNRFFGINADGFSTDELLQEKSQFILGFFKTYALINTKDDNLYSSLIVSEIDNINTFNPITIKGEKLEFLSRNEVVISESYAKKMKLAVNDEIIITIGDIQEKFYVAGIAKNTSIFFDTPLNNNTILMSPQGFARFYLGYSAGIVTHCFIKVKDSKDLAIVKNKAIQLSEPLNLSVLPAFDENKTENYIELFLLPIKFIASISIILCAVALIVLIKLLYLKDFENYKLLQAIGLSQKRIFFMDCLFGLSISLISGLLSIALTNMLLFPFKRVISIIPNLSINSITYLYSIIGGMILCFIAIMLVNVKIKSNFKIKNYLMPILLLASIITIIFSNEVYVQLFSKTILFFLVLIITPSLIGKIFSFKIFNKNSLIILYTKNLLKNKTYRKVIVFLLLSNSIILYMLTFCQNLNDITWKVCNNRPYDVLITNINNPTEEFIKEIKSINGVTNVEKGYVNLSQDITTNNKAMSVGFIALEQSGFDLFIANNEQAFNELNKKNNAILLGREYAFKKQIKINDQIITKINNIEYKFVVVGFVDDDFNLNNIAITKLEFIANENKPYANLLINTNDNAKNIVSSIYKEFPVQNLSVLSVSDFQLIWYNNAMLFVELLLYVCIIMTLLIFSIIFILHLLWHDFEYSFYSKMHKIGLKFKSNYKLVSIAELLTLIPIIIANLILFYLIILIFNDLAIIIRLSKSLNVNHLITNLFLGSNVIIFICLSCLALRRILKNKFKLS